MNRFVGAPQGYLDFDQRQADRRREAINAQHLQAIMGQMMWKQQNEARQRQQSEQAMEDAGGALGPMFRGMPSPPGSPPMPGAGGGQLPMPPGMANGPQPPMPGQSSQPSAPPGGIPTPPQGGPPPVRETAPDPRAALARMMELDRSGQQGSVTGQMPGARPVEPYRPLPAPPPGAGSPGEPSGAPGEIPPPPDAPRETLPSTPNRAPKDEPLTPTLAHAVQALTAQGLTGARLMRALEQIAPRLDAMAQQQIKALNVQLSAERARIAQQESERRTRQGDTRIEQGDRRIDAQRPVNEARVENLNARTQATLGGGGGQMEYDDATINRLAERVISGDPAVYREIGYTRGALESRRKVQERVTSLMQARGLDPVEQIVNRMDLAGATRAMTNRANFVSATNQFINNFDSQIDLVKKLAPKGTAGGVPVINKWIQSGRTALAGDVDVSRFDTALRGLAREHQRIVTGVTSNAQLHVGAQQTADELLNRAMTEEQIYGVLEVMKEEAENARKAGIKEIEELRARVRGMGGRSPAPGAGAAAPAAVPTATNPQTGEKLEFRDNQWQPAQTLPRPLLPASR